MRAINDHRTVLVVTDDPMLENIARNVAKNSGEVLQYLDNSNEAMCLAFDSLARETFAIVDVDASFSTRSMVNTLAGLLPVIAVAKHSKPWLQSMLRHRRIRAAVSRPVSPEALSSAVHRIRDFHGSDTTSGS